ncbi:MAG: hypothetical protein ABIC95_02560 [archaeon]
MPIKFNILDPDESLQVTYKGVFDLDTIYKELVEFYTSRSFEFHEYNYKAKDPTVGELEWYWQGWRNDTEFLRVWLNVYFHFEDMESVEVIKDGQKRKMVRGRVRARFRPFFELDYDRKFETSKFMEAVRHFYVQYIYRKKMLAYGDKEEYELHKFVEKLKKLLGMTFTGDQFADMY